MGGGLVSGRAHFPGFALPVGGAYGRSMSRHAHARERRAAPYSLARARRRFFTLPLTSAQPDGTFSEPSRPTAIRAGARCVSIITATELRRCSCFFFLFSVEQSSCEPTRCFCPRVFLRPSLCFRPLCSLLCYR